MSQPDPFDLGPDGPVKGLKVLVPGVRNGFTDTPDSIRLMAEAFAEYSKGDTPYYRPFVSINHDDGLSFGRITSAFVHSDHSFDVDADGVPEKIREWMRKDRLTAPSIEYWPPNTFRRPDGTPDPRPVLKCVTLLGNDAPAVKGLPPLSAAKYRDHSTGVRKYSDFGDAVRTGPLVDRQAVASALVALGLPEVLITPSIPDELLQAVLALCQKVNPPIPAPVVKMSDTNKPDATQQPADAVVKYRDAAGTEQELKVPKALEPLALQLSGVLDTVRTNAAASTAALRSSELEARRAKVRVFRDEMTGRADPKKAFMTPAQFDTQEQLLLMLDHATVRKYADGKTDGTALDEAMDNIRNSFCTPVKVLGEKINDGGKGGDGSSTARPDVVKTLLNSSPEGRAALERQQQAAK